MECNKEEASRAKKLAEEKMKAGDFFGAYKLFSRAQRLFPNLEIRGGRATSSTTIKIEPPQDLVPAAKTCYKECDMKLGEWATSSTAIKKESHQDQVSAETWYGECDKKLGGWARSSTAIKEESYDQVLETGEAKKMRSYQDVISEHNRRMEERQKRFDEGTSRWLNSLTAVKKESQDQEPAFQPLVKMNYLPLPPTAVIRESQDQEAAFQPPLKRNYLPLPKIFSSAGKKECPQDLEPVQKSIFEVHGFNNINERRRRREEELQKSVEEASNKDGSVAKRQRRMEEFEEKLGGFRASGRKESHDQESKNGAPVKMMRRRQMEDIRKNLEKSMKKVHIKPSHSDVKVRELATLWKGKIRAETPRSSSLDVLAFLHFIVAHKLHNSVINQEETTKLASSIAHHKEAPKLFQSLGLDDVIPGFVEELINTRQYIPAVRLICFFKLKGFSPLIILNKEIESQLAQEKDGWKSRDILELLADYKLEIDIPGELIVKLMCHQPDTQNQVQPLMDQVKNKKVELESTTNELRSTTVKLDEEKKKLKSLERMTESLKAELGYMREEDLTVRESIEDGKIELKKIQEDTNDARRNAVHFARKIREEIDVIEEANESIYQLTKQF